jgi:hypothetical protein
MLNSNHNSAAGVAHAKLFSSTIKLSIEELDEFLNTHQVVEVKRIGDKFEITYLHGALPNN